MSEQLTLTAETRDRAGKGASRELRNSGRVPAVVYGANQEPLSIHVEEKLLAKMLSTGHFMNSVVMIDAGIDGPSGPFCTTNGQCTVGGECCVTLGGPMGFCAPGQVVLGQCVPQ